MLNRFLNKTIISLEDCLGSDCIPESSCSLLSTMSAFNDSLVFVRLLGIYHFDDVPKVVVLGIQIRRARRPQIAAGVAKFLGQPLLAEKHIPTRTHDYCVPFLDVGSNIDSEAIWEEVRRYDRVHIVHVFKNITDIFVPPS